MLCSSGIDSLGAPCRLGRWVETESKLQQQLECVEMALSLYKKQPSDKVVEAYLQLADIFDDMFKHEDAVRYAELAVEQASCLEDSPLPRAQSLKTLGRICTDRGDTERAIELLQQSKDIYITKRGYESLHVASLLTSLGRVYHDVGRNDLAKTHYEDALKLCVHVTDTEGLQSNPLLAQTLASLGRAYLEPNYIDAEKAIHLLEQSLTARQRMYGHDHPITAMTLTALGRASLVNQQPHTAEIQLREALRIQQLTLPANHPDMANTLHILGNSQRRQGNGQAAVDFLQKSLDIRLQVFGSDHHDVGYCKNDLAMALLEIDRARDALPLLQEALRLKIDKYGKHHIEVAITYGCLSGVHRVLGDNYRAKTCLAKHDEITRQQTDSQMSQVMGNWQ